MSADVERVDANADSVGSGRERPGLELLAVLGVSYGMSGVTALLSFVRSQVTINHGAGFSKVATSVVVAQASNYQWLDVLDQLADVVHGVLPAFLALVLLARSPGGAGFGIGLNRIRWREIGLGAGFAALIGVPGLGLVFIARQLGLNAQLIVTDFPDVWYRIPVLLLDALQDGIAEEVVVGAFVLTRLSQVGWSRSRALAAGALLRGSYHLYQGYGGFIGNAVMGVIFGWWFQRTRRLWPLIVAHTIIDAVSFIGYLYLKDRVSWI